MILAIYLFLLKTIDTIPRNIINKKIINKFYIFKMYKICYFINSYNLTKVIVLEVY